MGLNSAEGFYSGNCGVPSGMELIMKHNEKKDVIGPVEGFTKTLYEANLDLATDYLEVSLDTLLKEGLLKEFPLVKSFFSAAKTGIMVRDAILARKVLIFAQHVQGGNCSERELEQHREKFRNDPNALNKELEIVLTYLDRHSKYTKSLILANFYNCYLRDPVKFSWNDFDYTAEMLDLLSLFDLKSLKKIYERKKVLEGEARNDVSLHRLNSCGMVIYANGIAVCSAGEPQAFIAKITGFGEFFWEVGMKDIDEKLYSGDIII